MLDGGRTITVKIDAVQGNTGGVKKVMADVQTQVDAHVKAFKAQNKVIEADTISSQKRVEANRKATTRAIEQSVKTQTDFEVKEAKRAADAFIKSMSTQNKAASESSKSMLTAFNGAFAGSFAGGAFFSEIKDGLGDVIGFAENAATKLFDMAKEASDLGRTFASFQTKTGLGAESISTLAAAAHLSGKELSDLQRPLVMFTKNLGEAAAGSEKTTNLLKKMGVTKLNDLEGSFSQALDGLAKMPPGVEKMNAAAVLFGRRGGLDMLSVLAKMPDGFNEARKHAAALGETLSQDDINAAKNFGVAYDQVSNQVKIAASKFALAYAPQITDAIKGISKWLSDNKEIAHQWGEAVSLSAYGVKGYFEDLDHWFQSHTLKPRIDNSWLAAINEYAFGNAGTPPKPLAGNFAGGYDSRFDLFGGLQRKGAETRGALKRELGMSATVPDSTPDETDIFGDKSPKEKKEKFKLSSRAQAIVNAATAAGISPLDLATIIGFETSGTYNPHIKGGASGNYEGLIQFGPQERKQYGVKPGQSFENQVQTSVLHYLQDRFAKAGRSTQGASLLDLYATVITGSPNGNINAKDAFGTSAASGVRKMFRENRPDAIKRFFGGKESNIPNIAALPDIEKFTAEQSDAATKAERDMNLRSAMNLWKMMGLIPDGQMLEEFRRLMTEDARKGQNVTGRGPGIQPTASDLIAPYLAIANSRASNVQATAGGAGLNMTITTSAQIESDKALAEVLADLDEQQFNLNTHTQEEILLRKIQLGQYPDLIGGAQELVLAKTREIDGLIKSKEAAEKYKEEQRQIFEETQNFFEGKLDALIGGGFKGLWKSILDDMRRNFVHQFSALLAQAFTGAGTTQGGAGGGFGGFLKNILNPGGAGNGPGGTPPFVGNNFTNSGGASNGSTITLPNGEPAMQVNGSSGGPGGLLGGLKGMFGARKNLLTGKTSKLAGKAGAIGDLVGMAGGMIGGKWGNFLSLAGEGVSIGSYFGPWGALIGGAIGAGAGLVSMLFGGGDEKKIKEAALSTYGLTVKDKSTLSAIKQLGEQYFGKGKAGANATQLMQVDEVKNILRNYAASTGQSGDKIDMLSHGDADWKGNQFTSRFGGFRAVGGSVTAGMSYVVGEHRAELFTPSINGRIDPTTGGGSVNVQMVAGLAEAVYQLKDEVARFRSMPADHVVMLGAPGASAAINKAVNTELVANPRAGNNSIRNQGWRS